jgi:predicted RNA-binding Zn-ribbon protein involved in translation (DUF1610 family)
MATRGMRCPACGHEMNHHADKVDYTAVLDHPTTADAVFGGVLEEVFTCPNCGRIEMRPAAESTPA